MTEIIPNGTGAEVREDINDEFTKLESSLNSSVLTLGRVPVKVTPNMTATIDQGCTIFYSSAATTIDYGHYPDPYRSFDGVYENSAGWLSKKNYGTLVSTSGTYKIASGSSDYLGIILPNSVSVGSYRLTTEDASNNGTNLRFAPYKFRLQGSNDTTTGGDGTWTEVDNQTGMLFNMSLGQCCIRTAGIPVAAPASFKAYRLVIDQIYTASSLATMAMVVELELFGTSSIPSPIDGQRIFDTNTLKSYVFYNGVWNQD